MWNKIVDGNASSARLAVEARVKGDPATLTLRRDLMQYSGAVIPTTRDR
jgi:hypothetical protein